MSNGLKAEVLASQRETESWLGPFGTESKNGSLVPKREFETSLLFAADGPGSSVLPSICATGGWCTESRKVSGKGACTLGSVAVESKDATTAIGCENWLWSPSTEVKAVSLVFGRDVEDWLGPAEVEANQESSLSAGDMV